jgi:hypothetical protein
VTKLKNKINEENEKKRAIYKIRTKIGNQIKIN